MAVAQLSRLDADRQMILRGWKRASGIRREGAGRIHRLVEIQDHFAVLWQIRIQKSTGRVSFLSRRLVPENEKEDVAFGDRVEAALLPFEGELHVAGLSSWSTSPRMLGTAIVFGGV